MAVFMTTESLIAANCIFVSLELKLPTLEATFCCAVPLLPKAEFTTAVLTNIVACMVGSV